MKYNYSNSFGFALSRASGIMKNRFHHVLRQFNITPDQTIALLRLSEFEGVSPTVLAEAIAKDKPNTVRILDKLLKKGLILIKESIDDKRSYTVYLTVEGVNLQEQLIPIAEELKNQALKGFTEAEAEQFRAFLKKAHDNLS